MEEGVLTLHITDPDLNYTVGTGWGESKSVELEIDLSGSWNSVLLPQNATLLKAPESSRLILTCINGESYQVQMKVKSN